MTGRLAHDRHAAEWMRIREAKITCQQTELMTAVKRRGAVVGTEKVNVDLFVVSFLNGLVDSSGQALRIEMFGAPAGNSSDALFQAMKQYPLQKDVAERRVVAYVVPAEAVADTPHENDTIKVTVQDGGGVGAPAVLVPHDAAYTVPPPEAFVSAPHLLEYEDDIPF